MYEELVEKIGRETNLERVHQLKLAFSREHHLKGIPRNIEILCSLPVHLMAKYRSFLVTKPVRTISGVAPLAIMTKPFACPTQAKCTYCPGGPGSVYGDTPKSYPGGSPAHLRGARNWYDSYLQVFNRLEHYILLNQEASKVELIILGGTFPAYPKKYREEFVSYALKAMNDFADLFFSGEELNLLKFKEFFELPSDVKSVERMKRVQEKMLSLKSETTLEQEQRRNETSKIRCVTFCIETRPDCSKETHIDDMLRLGATRVEIGVQSIYDDVLLQVERGHDNFWNKKASQLLRDSFLKVGYHMMLGLPGSTPERDVEMFKQLFSDEAYMPDALKIYPCMIFKGTKLYEQWKQGSFAPLNAREAAEIISEIKKCIPKWTRIMRVQRDIPTSIVEAGVERTNLRQEVHELLKKKGVVCKCIRCREPKNKVICWDAVRIVREEYHASGGDEVFLAAEDTSQDILLGFVRLRNPSSPYRPEITPGTVGIREVHVYGTAVKVGATSEGKVQHKGVGRKLVEEAERIAVEEFDARRMLIISGVGVREYFKQKFGYHQEGPYVGKSLA